MGAVGGTADGHSGDYKGGPLHGAALSGRVRFPPPTPPQPEFYLS
jgi:hypothetical protein